MINSRYIQRGEFKSTPKENITGLDSLIHFDYMGSSEFEWGALPKSLKEIVPHLDSFVITKTDHLAADNSKGYLYIYSHNDDINDVKNMIKRLLEDERSCHLKERTQIKEALEYVALKTSKKKTKKEFFGDLYATRINFWWDIQYNWMACLGEENAELLKFAMEKLADKWKTEKKVLEKHLWPNKVNA